MDLLIDDFEVARRTGRARSTLQKDRVAGRGIPFVKLGGLVRYRESTVDRHVAELPTFRSTSEAGSVGSHYSSERLEPEGVARNYSDCPDDARNLLGMSAEPGEAA